MTLLKIDGFDHQDLGRFSSTAGSPSFVSGASTRFGTGSALFGASLASATIGLPLADTMIFGFALKPVTAAENYFFKNRPAGQTNDLELYRQASGAIKANIASGAGILLGTSAGDVLPLDAWSYVEISYTPHYTTGELIIRVNGAVVFTFNGRTVGTNAVSAVNSAELIPRSSFFYFDDFYACDTLGAAPYNTFLGDVRVSTLVPTASGASSGLAGSDGNSVDNWALVDELPPSDVDYVSSNVSGTKDTYVMSDLPNTAPVLAVQPVMRAHRTDAGTLRARAIIRSGGVDGAGVTQAVGTAPATFTDSMVVNPATGAAWTAADVNNMEAGMEVIT